MTASNSDANPVPIVVRSRIFGTKHVQRHDFTHQGLLLFEQRRQQHRLNNFGKLLKKRRGSWQISM